MRLKRAIFCTRYHVANCATIFSRILRIQLPKSHGILPENRRHFRGKICGEDTKCDCAKEASFHLSGPFPRRGKAGMSANG
jgi:hypothetical protein